MSKLKNLSIECVNRVKLEKVEEFEDSIFSDVYKAAHMQIERIINTSGTQEMDNDAERFCNGNEKSNVISFVGERGMGKSSAMLSFTYFLKQYPDNIGSVKSKAFQFKIHPLADERKKLEESKEEMLRNANVHFYTLSKVDVAILTNESLFDVVLAKMWTDFSARAGKAGDDSYSFSHTKESFNSIKDVYTLYYKDEKQNKNLTSVSQLQELSRSLALREEFAKLVANFLDSMVIDGRIAVRDRFLVIPIDDLDLASEKTMAILEQLRIFLSVPQVIVLTTVDIEKLLLCGNKKFSDELMCESNRNEYEKDRIRQYSDQYIAKVLPRNSRIYMPKYGGSEAGKYVLKYDKYVAVLKEEHSVYWDSVDYFTFINIVIAEHLNLIIRRRDNLNSVTESLRNIVNKTNELWTICRYYQENAKDFIFDWLEKEITISANRFYDQQSIVDMKELFVTTDDSYNEFIIGRLTDRDDRPYGYGYGYVLCALLKYSEEQFGKRDYLKELILYYSLQIAKCMNGNEEDTINQLFVRNNIFSAFLVRNMMFDCEETKIIDGLLQLTLEYDNNIIEEQLIMQNLQQIEDIFKLLLFCDVENIIDKVNFEVAYDSNEVKEIPGKEKDSHKASLTIRTRGVLSWVSVDNFFHNVINYEELFKEYVAWIYKQLSRFANSSTTRQGKLSKKKFDPLYADILESSGSAGKMKRWKEYYGIRWIYDLLPIQDVGVMLGVIGRLEKENDFWWEIDDIINKLTESFVSEFEEAENGCAYGGPKCYRYSEKIKKLMQIFNLGRIPWELKNRFFTTGQQLEDTTKL